MNSALHRIPEGIAAQPAAKPGAPCVGHGILASAGGWSFGGSVWQAFDAHIRASVPGYAEVHALCIEFAGPALARGGRALDLGCATGALTAALAERYPAAEVIGIDVEPNMLGAARRVTRARPHYLCANLLEIELQPLAFATLCYTLMFIAPSDRLRLLSRIHRALVPGGRLVLAEKVWRRDPREQARALSAHHAFKLAQGLTEPEIAAKARSLQGRLQPLHEDENLELLSRAGFASQHLIARHACFDTWLVSR